MESVRDSWTDERLDDLNAEAIELRREMRDEFAAVRTEMHDEFAAVRTEMRDEFAAVRAEMREMREESTALRVEIKEGFDGLHRTMIRFQGGIIFALIGLIATQI